VERRVVHDYRMPFGYHRKQTMYKPIFKKLAIGRLLVTFNTIMFAVTQSANNIYPLKVISRFDVFNLFPSRGASVFPLCTGIYAAFININPFISRNSF
jgi:hypothetical protein